jgi:hypothetical protein
MTTFNDLPKHLQLHILEFNPEHREKLKDVLDELIRSQTYICDYEYCESEIPIGEEVVGSLSLHEQINLRRTFHFCNEHCKSAGLYWIMDSYKKCLRGWTPS